MVAELKEWNNLIFSNLELFTALGTGLAILVHPREHLNIWILLIWKLETVHNLGHGDIECHQLWALAQKQYIFATDD